MRSVVDEVIASCGESIDALVESILDYTYDVEHDIDEVGSLYVDLLELKNNLHVAVSAVEDQLNKLMAVSEILSVSDAGLAIEKVQGQSRVKWDNNTVRSILSEKIVEQFIDKETGALNVPVSRVIDEAFNVTGIRWKVTELKRLGINPDLYSEKKEGKISFRIASSVHSDDKVDNDNEDFI